MPPAMPAAGHIQLLKATEESIDIGITYECKRPRQGQGASALSVKDRGRSWQQKSRGKAYFSNDSKACAAAKRRACSNNGWVPIAHRRMNSLQHACAFLVRNRGQVPQKLDVFTTWIWTYGRCIYRNDEGIWLRDQ